jgi:signal transduction histidine kinase
VKERSAHIETQNQQLTEFAFFNAHKVRGPLARILGLVHLIKISPTDGLNRDLVTRLDESSKELDETIKEINKVLEDPTTWHHSNG